MSEFWSVKKSDYFAKLAAAMRAGLAGDGEAGWTSTKPGAEATLPDLEPSPDLLKIVALAKEGCRGVVELDDRDWEVLIDETLYQIARALARDDSIVLPSIGKIEITYGEDGPVGRVTLDVPARLEVVL